MPPWHHCKRPHSIDVCVQHIAFLCKWPDVLHFQAAHLQDGCVVFTIHWVIVLVTSLGDFAGVGAFYPQTHLRMDPRKSPTLPIKTPERNLQNQPCKLDARTSFLPLFSPLRPSCRNLEVWQPRWHQQLWEGQKHLARRSSDRLCFWCLRVVRQHNASKKGPWKGFLKRFCRRLSKRVLRRCFAVDFKREKGFSEGFSEGVLRREGFQNVFGTVAGPVGGCRYFVHPFP